MVDPIPSVAANDYNGALDVEITSPSPELQEEEEEAAQALAESCNPRQRKMLHYQGCIDGSQERDTKEEELEEEMSDVVTSVKESSPQALLRSPHHQSLESTESTETEEAVDSPHRIRRGQALKVRSRHGSSQSDDRLSVGKLSADQSSMLSNDHSKSNSSSTDNVPARELTEALVSGC